MNPPHLRLVDPESDALCPVPPHNLDAEGAVLCMVMIDETALFRLDFLRPEYFYSEAHRQIYQAALWLREHGKPIDIVTVDQRLRETDRAGQVGGLPYLTTLITSAGHARHVEKYGQILFELWRTRQIILTTRKIAAESHFESVDTVQGFADRATQELGEIARLGVRSSRESTGDLVKQFAVDLQAQAEIPATTRPVGWPTGLPAYDRLTGGFHPSQKTTLVGLPGLGKTTLALQMALAVAACAVGVFFVSTEQPKMEMVSKMISHEGGLDADRLKHKRLSPEEWSRFATASARIQRLPIVFEDRSDLNPDQIRSMCIAEARAMPDRLGVPLGLVVVDYVQRLKYVRHREPKKFEQATYATEVLKDIAKDLQISMLELAQQKNDDADKFSKKRPRPKLGCVAESFYIERDAHNLVYLWRHGEAREEVTLILEKQRNGPCEDILLTFQGQFSRFREATPLAERPRAGDWK